MTRRRKRSIGPGKAVSAGALVRETLARYGIAPAVREHRLVTEWRELVGERIAARARPDALRAGVLHVRVVSSAWLHELGFLREPLIAKINALLGPPTLVKDLRFHLGTARETQGDDSDVVAALSRRKPPGAKVTARRGADVATQRTIDEETAGVADPELRELVRGLRKRLGL